MHPELFGFIDAISERFPRADVGFTTNGHLLSDRVIHDVLTRPIRRVNVSLEELPWSNDGPGESPEPPLPVDHRTGNPLKGGINHVARDGHPTPPRVVERLRAFLFARNARAARGELAPEVRLQIVLFPGSEETTVRLVEFGAHLGFQAINLVRMDVRGRSDLVRPSWDEERRLIRLARARAAQCGIPVGSVNDHGAILRAASRGDRFCVRLDNYIYVDVEGNVAPCCLLRDHRLGNLTRQSLDEVWGSAAFKRFYGPGLHPACEGCDAFMNGYAQGSRRPLAVVGS
jgi:MoaA/NifB/PqqE/SkfB family radical SAM enzyme